MAQSVSIAVIKSKEGVTTGKTVSEAKERLKKKRRRSSSSNTVTTTTGTKKIEIFQPERDDEGLTKVDQEIVKRKKKQTISQVTYNDGTTQQTFKGKVVGSSFLGVRSISKEEQTQKKIASQPTYFLTSGNKKVQVSKGLYDKVVSDNKRKDEIPELTLTGSGSLYTGTGLSVQDARVRSDKENAFDYLAPAEKFLAKR